MKAIILAAGKGSRLKHLTRDIPKCLAIQIEGKSLLEIQINVFRSCGIEDIVVVRGYQGEKINLPGIKTVWNHDFETNNILGSMMSAETELSGDMIVSYSDILFDAGVVKRLLKSTAPIAVAADLDWRDHYRGRKDHPLSEGEVIVFDSCKNVVKIGKINVDIADAEFLGMLKLTSPGAELFKSHYFKAKQRYGDSAFQRAQVFEKAYITDLLQEMADLGVSVQCEIVGHHWKEIDTIEDLQAAQAEWGWLVKGETR